ncbi:MAG: DUF4331 domain-containing protein, partial [Actinobacteria bacterium]
PRGGLHSRRAAGEHRDGPGEAVRATRIQPTRLPRRRTTAGASGGWPNGRRLGDDVVDIALTAIASGPSYSTITVVGDNINANDQVYNQVFPYSATPHAGPTNRKDP